MKSPPGAPGRPDLATESEWIAAARAGDRQAFGRLYSAYGPDVYRSILRVLPHTESAEDCLRDAFKKAWERLDDFEDRQRSIFHWIRRIAINLAYDIHRKNQRNQRLEDALRHEVEGSHQPNPLARLEHEHIQQRIESALGALRPRYAEVIRLRMLQEVSRPEAAEQLGVSLNALDVLLHRACKAFRQVYVP